MGDITFYIPEIIFSVPILIGALRGYNRGLVLQLLSLMSLVLLFYGLTFVFYGISKTLYECFVWDIINTELVLTFLLTFVIILVVHVFIRMLYENFTDKTGISMYSRLVGFVIGALRYAFIISIFYNIWNQYSPLDDEESWFRESRMNSYVYQYNTMAAPFIFNYLDFDKSRDVEYVKLNTINFGGQEVPIEPVINFMCDSTKYPTWKYVPLREDYMSKDSSIVEVKVAYENPDNLNIFTYQFLLLKQDSLIFLHKYLENNKALPKSKGFFKLKSEFKKFQAAGKESKP